VGTAFIDRMADVWQKVVTVGGMAHTARDIINGTRKNANIIRLQKYKCTTWRQGIKQLFIILIF
jgi:hypothetical protein